jgi:hypothetical protein
MIYQHGEGPEDIRLAQAFATIASKLEPEHPAPKWLIAASWDRYLMWKKLPQWYGTQYQVSQRGRAHALPSRSQRRRRRRTRRLPRPLAGRGHGGGEGA